MKTSSVICLVVAAIVASAASLLKGDSAKVASGAIVTEASAGESEAPPVVLRMAQLADNQSQILDYQRGPRIIHVPQTHVRGNDRIASRAAVVADGDDDADVAPPPRPRVVTPKPRAVAPARESTMERTPRWKPRSETLPVRTASTPPPAVVTPALPRRAVLSAPRSSGDGPAPLRPTPRFDNSAADTGEKFKSLRAPVPMPPPVSETQPPLGYTPPVTPDPALLQQTSAAPDSPLPQE